MPVDLVGGAVRPSGAGGGVPPGSGQGHPLQGQRSLLQDVDVGLILFSHICIHRKLEIECEVYVQLKKNYVGVAHL